MSSSKLIRWSGMAALVGGLLLVIASILESVLFGTQPNSAAMASGSWIIVEVVFIAAEVLIILGLVGLYVSQAEKAGNLGAIAFLVAFTGSVMVSGVDWSSAFMAPWLTDITAPGVLDTEPTGAFIAGILLTFVLFSVGFFLFGLASLQTGVLPRGAAVLLMVGAVLFLVMGFLEIGFEGVVLGAALAWSGYALRSKAGEPTWVSEMAK
ncbi:MAG: hypothetical protein PVG14_04510 [Anaerolineales bacterium]